METPTVLLYSELQTAFSHFNKTIFSDALPGCLITLQRDPTYFGYFVFNRFVEAGGDMCDEIALNPQYFGVRPIEETLSTMVHEMAHLWQFHFGTPARGRYHNLQWANKMESLGLYPSSTGRTGGKRVGQAVSHYIIEGGMFHAQCEALLTTSYRISWADKYAPMSASRARAIAAITAEGLHLEGSKGEGSSSSIIIKPSIQTRSKYSCSCGNSVWGRPGLNIRCEDCNHLFVMVDPTNDKS